jgi:hypothetical protein
MNKIVLKMSIPGTRLILYVASFLVLSVAISLYFLPDNTDVYFAWTIYPPVSAAFLGAGYLASFLLEFLSAREKIWARARPAVPGVWVFTFLTMIITLLHLDRFHLNSPSFITRAGTWVWLGVYVSVPVAMGILWLLQARQPGRDPLRQDPLHRWLRAILVLQGGIMLLVGGVLILLPKTMSSLWPWILYPLSAQAIGAWGVGVGVIALQAVWENDWGRLFPLMLSYGFYGALQLVNLLRYPAALDWTRFTSISYCIFMLGILMVGAFGARRAWLAKRDRGPS